MTAGPRRHLFVSDVHLEPQAPDRAERFLNWLEALDPSRDQVWILGDLFDLWVADRQRKLPFYEEITKVLARVTAAGLRVSFVHGNRDFLVGRRFERSTGVAVFADPIVRELGDRRFLLTHGDLLCASDLAYQRLRRVLRSPGVRLLAALLPLRAIFSVGRVLRRKSDDAVHRKSESVLSPPVEAILAAAQEHRCDAVVFGHLHSASHRRLRGDGGEVESVVLGAWEEGTSHAVLERGRVELFVASSGSDRGFGDAGLSPIPIENGNGPGGRAGADSELEGATGPGRGESRRRVVTIDGPAGAGKSTVARRLAEKLSFDFLDTGAMYRAVTSRVLESGVDPADEASVAEVLARTELDWTSAGELRVDGSVVGSEIRSAAVTGAVSRVSAHPAVREAMVGLQRALAERRDLVAEGRDMGSVVFPDADIRFYLDADVAERARRRAAELAARGESVDEEALRAAIEARDQADRTRAESPLRRVPGMETVDTTGLAPDEVVAKLAEAALASFRGES